MSTCEINKQSNKIMKEKIEKQEEIATGVTYVIISYRTNWKKIKFKIKYLNNNNKYMKEVKSKK